MKIFVFRKKEQLLAFFSILLPIVLLLYTIFVFRSLAVQVRALSSSELNNNATVTRFDLVGLEEIISESGVEGVSP